jgi:hypothetical protein
MIVTNLSPYCVACQIAVRPHEGEDHCFFRIKLSTKAISRTKQQTLVHTEFPFRLAFAMTINKAQGQSLDHVGLDLRKPVFSHGQLYVALSQSTSPASVIVLLPLSSPHHTPNIVYDEILQAIDPPQL